MINGFLTYEEACAIRDKEKKEKTEPCFIMGIGSITPRIDYSQGNEFFNEFQTLDDIHKPALDGIGYQDSLNWQRAWWDDTYMARNNRLQTAAGKTARVHCNWDNTTLLQNEIRRG